MTNLSDKPSHHNLPVISNPIMIFEVVIAYLIQDITPKPLNSSQLGDILNISASPIPNITRFLQEIGVINTEKNGSYINYVLTRDGEDLAHKLINQENEEIYLKLSKLLPKYYVVQMILEYINIKSPQGIEKIKRNISERLRITSNISYVRGLEIVFDLMICADLIYIDSEEILFIGSATNGFKTSKITFENIYTNLVARDTETLDQEFIPDRENDFLQKTHHHHLTRVSDPLKVFEVLKAFEKEKTPLRTNDVALKLKHSPSATIKTIRFLGAMGLIIKGRIGRQQHYKLTLEGEFIAKELVKHRYDNAYSKLAELLPKYYVANEILRYIEENNTQSIDEVFSNMSRILEISGNKEYLTGLNTLIKIMTYSGLLYVNSENRAILAFSEDLLRSTVKRRIKFSVLQVNRTFGSKSIEEDAFNILLDSFTSEGPKVAPIKDNPNNFMTLVISEGRDENCLIGELAIVQKEDLPGAVSLSTLEVRALELEVDEGIYRPTHFVLKKQGRFVAIASESYRFGPSITSLPTIFHGLPEFNHLNFKLNYLVDRANFKSLDRFERIKSLEVRIATQYWDDTLEKMSPIEGLDYIIEEAKSNFGEIFLNIRYSAKRNSNLKRIKDSLNHLKEFFRLGSEKNAIKKALIEGKTEFGDDGYIDLLYDKIVVSEDVYIDQDDTKMVDKDSIYGALYRSLDRNEEFIARTIPHEEKEDN